MARKLESAPWGIRDSGYVAADGPERQPSNIRSLRRAAHLPADLPHKSFHIRFDCVSGRLLGYHGFFG